MKEYCVDLEIAKKLQENGFNVECYYKYRAKTTPDRYELDICALPGNYYQAPISDEILKELPKYIEKDGYLYFLYIDCLESGYYIRYESNSGTFLKEIENKKLSNALAKMWLYLKKEGYIK